MRFVYYLAAIGHRGLEVKLNILSKNLNHIYSVLNTKFDIVVNCYNSEDVVYNFVQQFTFLNKKMFHNKPGVLTELFLTNPHNTTLNNYDYILFMLDDVEIQELNLNEMIKIKEKYKIEILSPKVINSTHSFMNSYASHILTINNALEVYCLLLKYKDFKRFLSIHTVENKWMWGVDFLFGHFNIKTGVYNKSSVQHMLLPSKKNTNNANKLMRTYLRDINFYGNIKDIIAVKNIINLRSGATTKNEELPVNNNDNDFGKLMQINIGKNSLHSTTLKRNFNISTNSSTNSSANSSTNSSVNSSANTSHKPITKMIDTNAVKLLDIINKSTKNIKNVTIMNEIKYDKVSRINAKNLGVNIISTDKTSTNKTSTNKTSKFTLNNVLY
jgi:hypothetical protein